jgi:hypothetical protein
MNSLKIVIPIFVVITIVVIIFNFTQNEIIENQISQSNNSTKIEGLLEKIKNDKIKNDESENPHIPIAREWITSGPVKIDYSVYQLGQKIFVNIEQLNEKDEGQVVFLRPVNSTHHTMYHVMPFDGTSQRNNYYLTPDLSKVRGICDKDDLIGNWRVALPGTDYLDLEFKIVDSILPGSEYRYDEPKCD